MKFLRGAIVRIPIGILFIVALFLVGGLYVYWTFTSVTVTTPKFDPQDNNDLPGIRVGRSSSEAAVAGRESSPKERTQSSQHPLPVDEMFSETLAALLILGREDVEAEREYSAASAGLIPFYPPHAEAREAAVRRYRERKRKLFAEFERLTSTLTEMAPDYYPEILQFIRINQDISGVAAIAAVLSLRMIPRDVIASELFALLRDAQSDIMRLAIYHAILHPRDITDRPRIVTHIEPLGWLNGEFPLYIAPIQERWLRELLCASLPFETCPSVRSLLYRALKASVAYDSLLPMRLLEMLNNKEDEEAFVFSKESEKISLLSKSDCISLLQLAQQVANPTLSPNERLVYIKALASREDMPFVEKKEIFLTLLKDPEPKIRSEAIRQLVIDRKNLVLLDMMKELYLNDPSLIVRVEAVEKLGYYSDEVEVRAFLCNALLHEGNDLIRLEIVRGLEDCVSDVEVAQTFMDAYAKETDPLVKKWMLDALGRCEDLPPKEKAQVLSFLHRILTTETWRTPEGLDILTSAVCSLTMFRHESSEFFLRSLKSQIEAEVPNRDALISVVGPAGVEKTREEYLTRAYRLLDWIDKAIETIESCGNR